MNIVDSSGWLEYFADADNADFFAPAIENSEELLVPTISLYEVFKRVLQQKGENDALEAAAILMQDAFEHLIKARGFLPGIDTSVDRGGERI